MTIPILFLINALGAGGTERQLLYLLRGLDRTRFAPSVCTLFDDDRYPPHQPYVERLRELEIPRYTLAHGSGWQGRAGALSRLIGLEWRLRPRIVQSYLHYANLMSRAVRPFVPPHRLYTSARAIYLPGEIRSEARTWWLDDLLICNAPHVRQQVLDHTRRPERRVTVIPNGIPVEDFEVNPDPGLRTRLFGEVQFVLGYVGRIDPVKNIPTLIHALALIPLTLRQNIRVMLIGAVNEPETWRLIESLIAQHNLQAIVHRFDTVADVRSYYHAADVMILPSHREGLPNVILEAYAAGKPVIVSEGANRAGLVQPGVNGWQFSTEDPSDLANILTEVAQLTADERATYSRRARAVADTYSIEVLVERYTSLYTARSVSTYTT